MFGKRVPIADRRLREVGSLAGAAMDARGSGVVRNETCAADSPVTWFVVHYHFRPGGVRRVIETALPWVTRGRAASIVLLGGEAPEAEWIERLGKRVAPVSLSSIADPSFGYLAETELAVEALRDRVRQAIGRALGAGPNGRIQVWFHNAGLGRNPVLVTELARHCRRWRIPVVWHHHDWWFDHRWKRWIEMKRAGYSTARSVARATLPDGPGWLHAGLSRADAGILRKGFGKRAVWLPNPVDPRRRPDESEVRGARQWMETAWNVKPGQPVWLVPCRFLRRKNILEAILLARWLRNEAVVMTTAGPSSPDERGAWVRLKTEAARLGWPVLLSVLDRGGTGVPTVDALIGASEVILLTSIQEGFGLPYLEAAMASKPLLGRRLANVVPDLEMLGFRFPTLYDEVWVSTEWLRWREERGRQWALADRWKSSLPRSLRARLAFPEWLRSEDAGWVPFSGLTLDGQLDVLRAPLDRTREEGLERNRVQFGWLDLARRGRLPPAGASASAMTCLGGVAYRRRFWSALDAVETSLRGTVRSDADGTMAASRAFLANRERCPSWFPILGEGVGL